MVGGRGYTKQHLQRQIIKQLFCDFLGRKAGWGYIFHQFQNSKLKEMRTAAVFLLVQFLAGGHNNHLRIQHSSRITF
jgi:hypothetical protein